MITVGPTGNVVRGDVLDVNKSALERVLKDYDTLLYVKWNPKKFKGWGCWEIRRHPNEKTVADFAEYADATYVKIDYVEVDLVHHVKDLAFLDYSVLTWIKNADVWKQANYGGKAAQVSQWVNNLEAAEAAHKEQVMAKQRKELVYSMMQARSAIRDWKDRINSGVNPNLIGKFWK